MDELRDTVNGDRFFSAYSPNFQMHLFVGAFVISVILIGAYLIAEQNKFTCENSMTSHAEEYAKQTRNVSASSTSSLIAMCNDYANYLKKEINCTIDVVPVVQPKLYIGQEFICWNSKRDGWN